MADSFAKYAYYYDLLYKDKDYSSEVLYVNKLLEIFDHKNKNVLEFGSGTGMHGSALSKNGRFIQGVELSPEMVAQVVETENFKVALGDIGTKVFDEKFGTIISLFHVISYLSNREKQLQVFRNANRHLEINGHFIFDVWYTPAVRAQKPGLRVKRMSDEKVDVIRLAEPKMFDDQKNVEVNYTIFIRQKPNDTFEVVTESHLLHHFDHDEIASLAAESGFEQVMFEEFLTSKAAGEDTWGVTFVLRKTSEVF